MAYKAGRGIYSRLGFQEVDRVIQDDSQFGGAGEYGVYFMVYEIQRWVQIALIHVSSD